MNILIRIFKFAKNLWPYYLAISFFTIFLAVLNQLTPLFTKGAIDQISNLGHGHVDIFVVGLYAVLIFVSDLGQTLFSNIGGYLGDIFAIKLQSFMSNKYYEHLLSLPQSYFDNELTGKIVNRMNRGIDQISQFINMLSNNFLQFIFSTVFSLIIVAYYSWVVALMLFLLYPIFIGFTAFTSSKWQKYQKEINSDQDIALGRFNEVISQVKVVKSFIKEKFELKFFENKYKKIIKTTKPQSLFWHKQDTYRRVVLNIIFLFVFIYIFIMTAKGHFSIGTMVLLIQYAMLIRIPIFSISFLVDQSQRAIANTKDYFETMDILPDVDDDLNKPKLKIKNPEIEFKNVYFSYSDETILNNLSFKIEPNTKVALVGESGEGKTTIANLLLGLYKLNRGQILIDGQDISSISRNSLREKIGVVFQDPALFSGTIAENIAYSDSKVDNSKIIDVSKKANADDFIQKFKDKYQSQIGEKGLKLSGGQKQRIAIARALLKNAPILILDEATSSLDSKSEKMVQDALEELFKNRTTIIIAHRLSTIQHVDKIITIKNGQVDEVGTPSQLSSSGGIYSQLLKLQEGHSHKASTKLKSYDLNES